MYFQIWQSAANRQWYWRLRSGNHETVAQSEGYVSRQGALHAIGLLMDTTRQTPVREG